MCIRDRDKEEPVSEEVREETKKTEEEPVSEEADEEPEDKLALEEADEENSYEDVYKRQPQYRKPFG